MKILGIDPGSRATGYALLEVSGPQVRFLAAGVLSLGSDRSLPGRLASIGRALEDLLDSSRPDESAVEDLFHALNARSAFKLAHARGVILGVLARRGMPIAEYTPLQVKKAVSGYGLADKDALRSLLEHLLGIPPGLLTRDASDALAVALCHSQAIPLRDAVAAAERAAVLRATRAGALPGNERKPATPRRPAARRRGATAGPGSDGSDGSGP